jgi:hypothetical protein
VDIPATADQEIGATKEIVAKDHGRHAKTLEY